MREQRDDDNETIATSVRVPEWLIRSAHPAYSDNTLWSTSRALTSMIITRRQQVGVNN